MFTNAAIVGVLIAVTKLAGAVKVAVTARFFGAGDELDAYLIAYVLLAFFAEVVAGAFMPGFVPALIRVRSRDGEEAARRLAREGLGFVLAAMLAVTLLLALGGRWLLPLLASGFDPAKLDATNVILWGLLLWLPMGACGAAWRAVLNAHEIFAVPAAAAVLSPGIAIAFLYAGAARWGVAVLVAATLAGVAVEVAILGAAVMRQGYSIVPARSSGSPELAEVRRQYLPIVAGAVIASGCTLIDQAVAASMGSGSVSLLAYGTKIPSVLVAIGATAIATALLPEFSRHVHGGDWHHLRHSIRVSTAAIAVLGVPAVALLVWTSDASVRLFFQGGAFDAATAARVTAVQSWAMLQVPGAMLAVIAIRIANALSVNALIVRAGAVALVINTVGDLWLSRVMGVAGIALADSVGQLTLFAALGALLYWREPRLFRER